LLLIWFVEANSIFVPAWFPEFDLDAEEKWDIWDRHDHGI